MLSGSSLFRGAQVSQQRPGVRLASAAPLLPDGVLPLQVAIHLTFVAEVVGDSAIYLFKCQGRILALDRLSRMALLESSNDGVEHHVRIPHTEHAMLILPDIIARIAHGC